MLGSIPFEIPARFVADVASGSVVRYGGLLKDAASGQIVAHLQETGSMARHLGSVLSGVNPFDPVSAVSSVFSNVQLAKLQKAMEVLQITQWATLGVSLAGVGVSLVGFKIMNDRFNRVDEQLSRLKQHIDTRFDEMVEREYRKDLRRIRELLDEAAIAGKYSDSASRLREISAKLDDHISGLREGAESLMNKSGNRDPLALRWLWSLVEGLVTGINARIHCLANAGEMAAAIDLSYVEGKRFHEIFREFSAVRWLEESSGSVVNARAYQARLENIKPMEHVLREVQDQLDTRPLLLEHLDHQGIALSDLRQHMERETREPVLCLPV